MESRNQPAMATPSLGSQITNKGGTAFREEPGAGKLRKLCPQCVHLPNVAQGFSNLKMYLYLQKVNLV